MEQKVLSLGKVSAVATGGLAAHFGLLKILFFEHQLTTRKPTMIQKGIITLNPIYVTKVTYTCSQ